MTYLIAADLPATPAGQRFRALLAQPGILQIPGTHNGHAALQSQAAGFKAAYLSGAAISASMGLPDLGIITVDEVACEIASNLDPSQNTTNSLNTRVNMLLGRGHVSRER